MILPEFINYIVKKGDNLYNIAKNNNIDIDTLKKDNNLSTNNLSIGQVLKIRIYSEKIEECFSEDYNENDNFTEYTVKKGDSLYSIAIKNNTSVNEIKKINNLSTNNLSVGQVLKIPVVLNNTIYTVVKGDSLWSIANKFNTSVETIKNKNNLKTNNLSIGQKLNI